MTANPDTGFGGASPNGAVPESDDEDHYSLLGVPFAATHKEITAAYRRAMKRTHPDRVRPERRSAAEERARRLNAAYAIISNPITRQAYDRTIRQQVIQDQVMRRYVGGIDAFGGAAAAAQAHARREPTARERRERARAERQASLTLVVIAVGLTALILISLLFGSFLVSLLDALR